MIEGNDYIDVVLPSIWVCNNLYDVNGKKLPSKSVFVSVFAVPDVDGWMCECGEWYNGYLANHDVKEWKTFAVKRRL
ncbi:MAG: hypothetical protein H7836_13160 [Magnetococcus sp. YQC-3]